MATQYANIVVRRGNAESWADSTRPLEPGEWGYDDTSRVTKIGDGYSLWAELPIHLTASANGELPEEVRARLAANLGNPETAEGAAVAASAGAGLPFDENSGLYLDASDNPIPSVAAETKQFPGDIRERIADNLIDPATPEGAAIDGIFSGLLTQTRQFVYFGDSWGTQLYNGVDPLPKATIGRLGAKLVKNYAVSGAIIGPTSQNSGNSTDAQVAIAQADGSYNKSAITDVVVLAGVNNIGGYLPTVDGARGHFQAIASLFPKARLWFATNAKKAINNAGDNDPWRWYNRFFEGASLAGYAVAESSPMWTWSGIRSSEAWWDPTSSTDSSRHPTAAGLAAVAGRLAGFLTGESWRPYFKVPTALHSNAAALMTAQGLSGTPTLSTDDTVIDGTTLRLNVSIGGMDALSAVPTAAFQPILQIPTAYMPIGNYLLAPAGCRLSGGTMDFTYALRVNQDGPGVVSVDPRLLNNHVGYFVLRADLPLNMVKTAD